MDILLILCIIGALIFLGVGINLLNEELYSVGAICIVIGIVCAILMGVRIFNTPSTPSTSSSSSSGHWGNDGYYHATPKEADKAREDALKWMEENW